MCRARGCCRGLDFRLIGYVASDTNLTYDEAQQALVELNDAGLIGWDAKNEVVLDYLALVAANINKSGDNRIAGALRQLRAVGQTSLYDTFIAHVEAVSPVLAEAIRESEPRKPLTRPKTDDEFWHSIGTQNSNFN